MNYDKYDKLIEKVDKEINICVNKSNEEYLNTKQAIMFLNSKMNYIKHKFNDERVSTRHDKILDYLTSNFGKIDNKKISKILFKNFILTRNIYLLMGFIIGFVVDALLLKAILYFNFNIFLVLLLILIWLFLIIPLTIAFIMSILDSSKIRLYRLKDINHE